jgi:thiamine biosynthesis lipoprotein
VGYRNVELDSATRTVMLKRAGMRLDLGGIAKGYAADEAIAVLRSRGIDAALVALGGDIRVLGAPPGRRGWKIDIENPAGSDAKPLCSVTLRDMAISTSGDTRQFTEAGGERYSHIVQPSSGLGLRDASGTSVIARDGITADALATALSVMPVAEGLKLVELVEGASAFMVRRRGGGFERFRSPNFPRACGE